MSTDFKEYCAQSHMAKMVGGPKVFNGILIAGGMAIGAVGLKACQELPRFAAWSTSKIDNVMRRIRIVPSSEDDGISSQGEIQADSGAAQFGVEDICSIGRISDEPRNDSLEINEEY